jgi:hypothetical protein
MRLPNIQGVIDRRILVNYRVRPELLAAMLPRPFRPQIVRGYGVAGICLIRLSHIRPAGLPAACGLTSENAAHRIAVEWDQEGQVQSGVYIPRRDTSSRLNAMVGGRLFPGAHHLARYEVEECDGRYRVRMRSVDGTQYVEVSGSAATTIPGSSVFGSTQAASEFFRCGSLGWSPTADAGRMDCLRLLTCQWRAEPLAVDCVRSSYFDDRRRFPAGSIEFDCALLMRGIAHQWQVEPPLRIPYPSDIRQLTGGSASGNLPV